MSSDAKQAKQESTEKILKKKGVVGIGVGKKIVDGIETDQSSVQVYVQKKQDKNSIRIQSSGEDIIPQEIGGIPTDIIEVGDIELQTGFKQKMRPVKPGYSISHQNVSAGTIGGFFLDKDDDVVILSNYHVLADDGKAKIGDIIYQPGVADTRASIEFKGWERPHKKLAYIGTLKDFQQLVTNSTNFHDSAICKIHPDLVKAGLIETVYPELGKSLVGFTGVKNSQNVYKCGRTTGFTTGKVIGQNASFNIDYSIGKVTFDDLILTSAMSKGGDSGSIGMDSNMRAFGLLFAGSQKVTLYNPIKKIIERYGLRPLKSTNTNLIKWKNREWSKETIDGKINKNKEHIVLTDNPSHHCFIESSITKKRKIRIRLHTGSDKGKSCGIGAALIFPRSIIKINFRYNESFGVYHNENVNLSFGLTKPQTTYTIEFKAQNDRWLGYVEFKDGKRIEVINIPTQALGGDPTTIRIGKMGKNHGSEDREPKENFITGRNGISQILNFVAN